MPDAATNLDIVRAPVLGAVPHGFFGRAGGVSTGLFAGLNTGIGSGDDASRVAANRARAAAAILPCAPLVAVYQVHSSDCVTASAAWSDADRPHADALVTATPGLVLGIVTADCAPVLLADPRASVIGAAHAGWRGALSGVIARTIGAMIALGAEPSRIVAAIGPCIGQASYEVDEVFADRITRAGAEGARFLAPGRARHYRFDLGGYVAKRLADAGIGTVEVLPLDTYALPARYYSFRRATHLGEPAYGRQLSAIALAPPG